VAVWGEACAEVWGEVGVALDEPVCAAADAISPPAINPATIIPLKLSDNNIRLLNLFILLFVLLRTIQYVGKAHNPAYVCHEPLSFLDARLQSESQIFSE
jgi:hypothetical protein